MTAKHIGLALGVALFVQVGCARQVKRPPDAARLYEMGDRLYDDRSYDMALEMLEASMRLEANPRTATRLADCHERLDHLVAARRLRRYARVLASGRSR